MVTRKDGVEQVMSQAVYESIKARMADTPDPGLLGWFVSMFGKWTVMLLIDGQVVSVSGFVMRHGQAPQPPESP